MKPDIQIWLRSDTWDKASFCPCAAWRTNTAILTRDTGCDLLTREVRCGVRGDGETVMSATHKQGVVQRTKVRSSRTETSDAIAGHRWALRVRVASRLSGVGAA